MSVTKYNPIIVPIKLTKANLPEFFKVYSTALGTQGSIGTLVKRSVNNKDIVKPNDINIVTYLKHFNVNLLKLLQIAIDKDRRASIYEPGGEDLNTSQLNSFKDAQIEKAVSKLPADEQRDLHKALDRYVNTANEHLEHLYSALVTNCISDTMMASLEATDEVFSKIQDEQDIFSLLDLIKTTCLQYKGDRVQPVLQQIQALQQTPVTEFAFFLVALLALFKALALYQGFPPDNAYKVRTLLAGINPFLFEDLITKHREESAYPPFEVLCVELQTHSDSVATTAVQKDTYVAKYKLKSGSTPAGNLLLAGAVPTTSQRYHDPQQPHCALCKLHRNKIQNSHTTEECKLGTSTINKNARRVPDDVMKAFIADYHSKSGKSVDFAEFQGKK